MGIEHEYISDLTKRNLLDWVSVEQLKLNEKVKSFEKQIYNLNLSLKSFIDLEE